jgi:hypothetical protein
MATLAGQVTGPALACIAPDLRPLAVPVASLQPAPDNARRHSLAKDLPLLMASLERFDQRKPIVAMRRYRGRKNVVLAGNGTLEAARRLGWSHVAVAWFDGTDDEAREYAVADNRTAELSEWDVGQLAALRADGVDLAALWGDADDLAALLSQPVADADWSAAFAGLPTDEPTFVQRTFTLSAEQAALVERALATATRLGPFEDTGNENGNGNALARVAEAFLAAHGEPSS